MRNIIKLKEKIKIIRWTFIKNFKYTNQNKNKNIGLT